MVDIDIYIYYLWFMIVNVDNVDNVGATMVP